MIKALIFNLGFPQRPYAAGNGLDGTPYITHAWLKTVSIISPKGDLKAVRFSASIE